MTGLFSPAGFLLELYFQMIGMKRPLYTLLLKWEARLVSAVGRV